MNKLLKSIRILGGMCLFAMLSMACPNNSNSKDIQDEKLDEIKIVEVRLNGVRCAENTQVEIGNAISELSIKFEQAYKDLFVKVNGDKAKVEGKVATAKVSGITEKGLVVAIEAVAKDKATRVYSFKAVLNKGEIRASVTFDGKPCTKDATIETSKTEGDVAIIFDDLYEQLSVKINDEVVELSGKVANKKISNIKENGTEVRIEATANGKRPFTYKFAVKKLSINKIGIENVIFDGKVCVENSIIETENTEDDVKVTFIEAYEGLQVAINGESATLMGKVATAKVSGITPTGIEVIINATATGKDSRAYKFTLKKVEGVPKIKELIFTGKNINADAQFYKDEKAFYADKAPFISEILSDGSTKIGDVYESRVKVTVKYTGTPSNPKLEIKNTTTNISDVSTTDSPVLSIIDVSIDLQKGQNNLVITYKEDGKLPLIYKVIVGYEEPTYEPVSRITVNGNWYATNEAFEKLESGNESIVVAGQTFVEVEVEMPETWYHDANSYTVKIDGVSCLESDFRQTAWAPDPKWTCKKDVALTLDGTKKLKIEFENVSRSYKKEYKVDLVHYSINELDNLTFVDVLSKKKVEGRVHKSFKFDAEKSYYKTKVAILAEDRTEKAHVFVSSKEENIVAKYAFSNTLVQPKDVSLWQEISKKTVSYIDGFETVTKDVLAIENQVLNYGNQYLYLLLEKGMVKTYYITEIVRDKAKINDVSGEQELVYQDNSANKLEDEYPLATKGLIRVLPKNPRAKVALVTPAEKDFEKKADGWFECLIELPRDKTEFSYNITAEDNVTKRLYNNSYDQAFRKAPIIKDFKFDYKQDGYEEQRFSVRKVDSDYYISIDKNRVKDNKVYLFIKGYKNFKIGPTSDLTEIRKIEGENYTGYIFAQDVSSLFNSQIFSVSYPLSMYLNGVPYTNGSLSMKTYLHDEVVKAMYVRGNVCVQMPKNMQENDNKWVCKADMNISGHKRLVIDLYLLENETAENTKRCIKILKENEEKLLSIDESAKNELSFFYNNFDVGENEHMKVTIQYFEDKTQSSPTKTYVLEIEDL